MGEETILREAVAELVNDGDSVALEGFTHLIPTATRSSEAKEATGWDLKVAEELETLRDLKARTEASRKKALMRAGITPEDVGLIEFNEAFAAQSLAVLYEWGMDPEDERLNPNGDAIALGHPLGASGARILTTLLYEMHRRNDVRYGLATMCIGVGQGIAMVVENPV